MTEKYVNIGGHYYETGQLNECWKEFEKKTLVWISGLETPSAIDRIMYDILKSAYPHTNVPQKN